MHIKIYFGDKPLFLCDAMTPEITEYSHHDDAVLIDEFDHHTVNTMIREMRQPKVHAGIFVYKDVEALRKAFWRKFLIVKAGGGLVQNEEGRFLFMLRRGIWDLPKGKLDAHETIERCALREVEEETGLRSPKLGQPLLVTYHTYDESGHHILKETHWYNMRVTTADGMKPQAEEQITELRWVDRPGLKEVLAKTYPSIRDVIRCAGS
jgi:8-oxo-dGTP pyrophosphatase MutT (NUDIX family)